VAEKKYVSTSRADRTENKRAANRRAVEKKKRTARDAGLVGLGAAGAVAARAGGRAAKAALNKPPKPAQLYRANQATNLKAMTPIMKGMSKEDIMRSNRKAAIDLARKGLKQSGNVTKGAKGSGWGSGLRKDDMRVTVKPAKKGQGMGSSRYSRITGGGGAPGRGMGQGGRGGGGRLMGGK
jgi:hypothetical protein